MNTQTQFTSQMNFLKTYAESYEQKRERVQSLKTRLDQLAPYIEESGRLTEELNDINKSVRLDEKFLMSMNEMVQRNTGEPITNGPLFEKANNAIE